MTDKSVPHPPTEGATPDTIREIQSKVERPPVGTAQISLGTVAINAKAKLALTKENERQETGEMTLKQHRIVLTEFIKNYPKVNIAKDSDYFLPDTLRFLQEHFRESYNVDTYLKAMEELGYNFPIKENVTSARQEIQQFKRRRNGTRITLPNGVARDGTTVMHASNETYDIISMRNDLRNPFSVSTQAALDAEGIRVYYKGRNLYEIYDRDLGLIYEFDDRGAVIGARAIGQPRQEEVK